MGYADTFAKLGPGVPCDATHACMLDELVGCVAQPCIKSGYGYFLVSTSGAAPFPDFASSSTPVGWGSSGQANFAVWMILSCASKSHRLESLQERFFGAFA